MEPTTTNPYEVSPSSGRVILDLGEPVEGTADVGRDQWIRFYRRKLWPLKLIAIIVLINLMLWIRNGALESPSNYRFIPPAMIFLAVMCLFSSARLRFRVNKNQLLIGRIRYRVGRDSVYFWLGEESWQSLWTGINELVVSDDGLYLFADIAAPKVYLPASELGTPWAGLKQTLEKARHEILQTECADDFSLIETLSDPTPEGAICYRLSPTGATLAEVGKRIGESQSKPPDQKGVRLRGPKWLWITGVIVALLLMLFFQGRELKNAPPSPPSSTTEILETAFAIAAPIFVLAIMLFSIRQRSKQNTSDEVISKLQGWVSEGEIFQMGWAGSVRMPWSSLTKLHESESDVILKHKKLKMIFFLSADYFESTDDWQRAREIIEGQVADR